VRGGAEVASTRMPLKSVKQFNLKSGELDYGHEGGNKSRLGFPTLEEALKPHLIIQSCLRRPSITAWPHNLGQMVSEKEDPGTKQSNAEIAESVQSVEGWQKKHLCGRPTKE